MSNLSHRKASAKVRILRADGTSAAHADVTFDQVSHDFLFGCGGFEALALLAETDEAKRAFIQDRLDKWLDLFNYATLPFYWGRFEPVEGQPMTAPTLAAARWFRERGVTLKGHPLCWHTVCADWLMQYPDEVILDKQLARIHREVEGFRGVIDLWDVINEVVIMPVFDKYDNAVTRLCKRYGRVGLVKRVFDAAVASNPDGAFLINDFNVSPDYERLLEDLLEAGVPITAIGIQSHQHQGYWGLEKLADVLERFGRFGLPIHFTENTILSGALTPPEYDDLNDYAPSPWPSTPEGEARQAEQMAEFYTALFAHPRVEAVTTWSFTDDGWLEAPGGLLAKDNRPKPAYFALKDLIHGAWETHATLRADGDGWATLEGFRGDYAVRAVGQSGKLSLRGQGDAVTLRLAAGPGH